MNKKNNLRARGLSDSTSLMPSSPVKVQDQRPRRDSTVILASDQSQDGQIQKGQGQIAESPAKIFDSQLDARQGRSMKGRHGLKLPSIKLTKSQEREHKQSNIMPGSKIS